MKNQYFGDINDYRKYGLLRAILDSTRIQMLVAWMLTPDDGSTDGKLTKYLEAPDKWRCHDPELFDGVKALMTNGLPRSVDLIERAGLLPSVAYHSEIVPDSAYDRDEWFRSLQRSATDSEIVFLDPDNGLEVKSRPYGHKDSRKFLYWREIQAIWEAERSILIYQHFPREERQQFIKRMLESLRAHTAGAFVEAFSTPHVAFLLALHPRHHNHRESIVRVVQNRWARQITPWSVA